MDLYRNSLVNFVWNFPRSSSLKLSEFFFWKYDGFFFMDFFKSFSKNSFQRNFRYAPRVPFEICPEFLPGLPDLPRVKPGISTWGFPIHTSSVSCWILSGVPSETNPKWIWKSNLVDFRDGFWTVSSWIFERFQQKAYQRAFFSSRDFGRSSSRNFSQRFSDFLLEFRPVIMARFFSGVSPFYSGFLPTLFSRFVQSVFPKFQVTQLTIL